MTNEQKLREALQDADSVLQMADRSTAWKQERDRCRQRIAGALSEPQTSDEGTPTETPLTDAFSQVPRVQKEWLEFSEILERTLHAKERELHEKQMELVGANASIRQLNQMLEWKDRQSVSAAPQEGKADKITGCLGIKEGAPIPQQDCVCLPCEVARERGYDEKNQWSPGDGGEDVADGGWCRRCGCGNDSRGFAHLPTCSAAPQSGKKEGWLPIETAPKGGGAELVTDPKWVAPPKILLRFGDEAISVAYWDWYYAEGGSGHTNGFAWVEPCSGDPLNLHYSTPPDGWMPLPSPPASKAEGET